jgi:hypothetical protein
MQRGSEGAALVDQAWRTPGVRELIAIPLYLNALLAVPPSPSYSAGLEFELTGVAQSAELA